MFRLFPNVHVNFTVFGMIPYDTSDRRTRNYDNGLNLTLAQDSVALLKKVVEHVYINRSVEEMRKHVTNAIKMVRLIIL